MPTRLLLLAFALAPALALADDPPPGDAAPPPEVSGSATSPAAAHPERSAGGAESMGAPVADAPPAAPSAAEPPAAPLPEAGPPAAAASPAAPPVEAGAPAAAAVTAEQLPPPPPPPPQAAPYPRFGFALGAGVPQAATLDLLYRPFPWLRLSAGPSWDYVGWGLHGGVVLSPIRWAISPTIGVEAGRFFELDVNKFAKVEEVELQPLLRRVQVQYVAATLGLEFGSQRGFAFALRAGLTYLQVDAHGTGQFNSGGDTPGANDAVITVTDPTFRGTAPTVQLVFQYFL